MKNTIISNRWNRYRIEQMRLITYMILLIIVIGVCISCDSFLEVDFPENQLSAKTVFQDDASALAALSAIYSKMRDNTLFNGESSGLSLSMGVYADELDYYGAPGQPFDNFYKHTIQPGNTAIATLWDGAYQMIYMANALLEGIADNDQLSPETIQQIKGEALFLRGLVHYYLAQLFGDIPYVIRTDYQGNMDILKMKETDVYKAVIADLKEAKSFLKSDYDISGRIRPNIFVVSALLARVYLTTGDWELGEQESDAIISNTSLFNWESDLEKVFLKGSSTAIWQLKPESEGENTREAISFIFTTPPPLFVTLSEELMNSFEDGDLRKSSWIQPVTDGTNTWYYPYKYHERTNTGTTLEYSVIFRLAEQYLIRAECRMHTGNMEGARGDLNIVRERAGLEDITTSDQDILLQTILHEKRVELFTELGIRWFDLKRIGKAGEVLASLKPGWKETDVLLPLPEKELLLNPNLLPQNPGY